MTNFDEYNVSADDKLANYNEYVTGNIYQALTLPQSSRFELDLEVNKPEESEPFEFMSNSKVETKNNAATEKDTTAALSEPEEEEEEAKPDFVTSMLNFKYPELKKEDINDTYLNPETNELFSVTKGTAIIGKDVSADFNWERFKQRLSYNESGHNYRTLNMWTDKDRKTGKKKIGSGAWGRYQFIWSHSGADIARVTGITDPLKFLDNPAAQDKFFIWQFNNNLLPGAKRLRKQFPQQLANWSDEQLLEMIHFQGADGLAKRLKEGSLNEKSSINPSVIDRLNKNVNADALKKQGFLGKLDQEQLRLYNANKHLVKPK